VKKVGDTWQDEKDPMITWKKYANGCSSWNKYFETEEKSDEMEERICGKMREAYWKIFLIKELITHNWEGIPEDEIIERIKGIINGN
jgi:hypothetical protein